MDSAGIIGFIGDKVVLHKPTVEKLQKAHPDSIPVLERFSEALARKQIEACDVETDENGNVSRGACNASGVRIKRKYTDAEARGNVTPPSKSSDLRGPGSVPFTALEVLGRKNPPKMPRCKSPFEVETVVRDLTDSMTASASEDNLARRVKLDAHAGPVAARPHHPVR